MIIFSGYKYSKPCIVKYDSQNKRLFVDDQEVALSDYQANSSDSAKKKFIRLILGTKCNLQCSYCSQLKTDIEYSISDCDSFIIPENTGHIEFWGGEPLIYRKYIDRLMPKLKEQGIKASLITNGYLLDADTIEWLNKNSIAITISHDGPSSSRESCRLSLDLLSNLNDWMVSSVISPGDSVFSLYNYFEKLDLLHKLRVHPKIFNITQYTATQKDELITASEIFTIAATNQLAGIRWDVHTAMSALFQGHESCSLNEDHVYVMDIKNNLFACQNYVRKQDILSKKAYIPINSLCDSCIIRNICGGGCKIVNDYCYYASCRSYFTYYSAIFSAAIFFLTGVILDKCESITLPYWNINKIELREQKQYQMPYLIESALQAA